MRRIHLARCCTLLPLLSAAMLYAGCTGTPQQSTTHGTEEDSSLTPGPADTIAKSMLVGTEWLVEDISGLGVIDNEQTTLRFEEEGRVSGITGCNRYTGSVTMEGNNIRFGPLASTRRACVQALMDQEQKFLEAMEAVRAYAIDAETGLLHLTKGEATLLRLSRVEGS